MREDEIIKYPLSTEKAIRLMESENKLVFVVDARADKKQVKEAMQNTFKAKVDKVNLFTSQKGVKKAYIKFNAQTPAIDIATQLGLI